MTLGPAGADAPAGAAPVGARVHLTAASALGLGIAMLWFSLLVLIPLAAVVVTAAGGGWVDVRRTTLTNAQTWRGAAADRRPGAAASPRVNVVMGTVIAWVLVRDRFRGKARPRRRHRHPVRAADDRRRPGAALALRHRTARSASTSANTRTAVFLALAFVTLPFVVRTVQPVLEELDADVEEAAASLGAEPADHLPPDHPAEPGARRSRPVPRCRSPAAISEYGSLVLLSGNLPVPHRGRLGAGAHATSRTATPPAAAAVATRDAGRRARRDRRPRRDPEAGGPPWLAPRLPRRRSRRGALRLVAVVYVFLLVVWPVGARRQAHLRRRPDRAPRRAARPRRRRTPCS